MSDFRCVVSTLAGIGFTVIGATGLYLGVTHAVMERATGGPSDVVAGLILVLFGAIVTVANVLAETR